MNLGNPYYGEFNTPQQRANQSTGWNRTSADSYSRSGFLNYLVGRLVFSPEQITPQEIPTNGTPAIFPLNDGSAIYVKSMQGDGTFAEYKYVLEKPAGIDKAVLDSSKVEQTTVSTVETEKTANYDDLVKRVDFLEQLVNELLKPAKVDQNETSKEV